MGRSGARGERPVHPTRGLSGHDSGEVALPSQQPSGSPFSVG
jgi:hypothetical protein